MDKKIGFIGAGNMASAMIGGLVASKLVKASNILVTNTSEAKLIDLANKYGVTIAGSNKEIAENCDIVIPAVKPHIYPAVLREIKASLKEEAIVVSIAAGVTLEALEEMLGRDKKIVRTMPNTPALVGEGMSMLCPNKQVLQEELKLVVDIFNSFGKTEVLPESMIHSVIGVSGSSPAYVFMFIEAMADAAVLGGMPRAKAYSFAAQAVLGAAKMVLETGKHPGELKDMVCSPGGTTIEAVKTLEDMGFRAAVMQAMVDCMDKSKEMSEKK